MKHCGRTGRGLLLICIVISSRRLLIHQARPFICTSCLETAHFDLRPIWGKSIWYVSWGFFLFHTFPRFPFMTYMYISLSTAMDELLTVEDVPICYRGQYRDFLQDDTDSVTSVSVQPEDVVDDLQTKINALHKAINAINFKRCSYPISQVVKNAVLFSIIDYSVTFVFYFFSAVGGRSIVHCRWWAGAGAGLMIAKHRLVIMIL